MYKNSALAISWLVISFKFVTNDGFRIAKELMVKVIMIHINDYGEIFYCKYSETKWYQ